MRKKDEQGEVSAEGVGAVGKVADLEDRIDELERVKAQLKNYDVELARVSAEMEKRVSQLEVEGENQRTIQALGLRLLYQPVEFRREAKQEAVE